MNKHVGTPFLLLFIFTNEICGANPNRETGNMETCRDWCLLKGKELIQQMKLTSLGTDPNDCKTLLRTQIDITDAMKSEEAANRVGCAFTLTNEQYNMYKCKKVGEAEPSSDVLFKNASNEATLSTAKKIKIATRLACAQLWKVSPKCTYLPKAPTVNQQDNSDNQSSNP
jgi:hypothetical protein